MLELASSNGALGVPSGADGTAAGDLRASSCIVRNRFSAQEDQRSNFEHKRFMIKLHNYISLTKFGIKSGKQNR